MGLGIASFSRFITEMNDRTREADAEELARWAVGELSHTIGFDAAWYGWAKLRPEGVEVYANWGTQWSETRLKTPIRTTACCPASTAH